MKVNAPSVSAGSFWARRCTSHQTLGCRVFCILSLFFFWEGGWDSPSSDQCWPLAVAQATCIWRFSSNWGSTDQFILPINSSYWGVLWINSSIFLHPHIILLVRFWHYYIISSSSSSSSGFCLGSSREKISKLESVWWNPMIGLFWTFLLC